MKLIFSILSGRCNVCGGFLVFAKDKGVYCSQCGLRARTYLGCGEC